MKNLLLILAFLSSFAFSEVKISQLPLGMASLTTSADTVPYVNFSSSATLQLKLWDLINLPPVQNLSIQTLTTTGNIASTAGWLSAASSNTLGTRLQLSNTGASGVLYTLNSTGTADVDGAGFFKIFNSTGNVRISSATAAGAWTFGPSAFSGTHIFNGTASATVAVSTPIVSNTAGVAVSGTNTNDSAGAGVVGEYLVSRVSTVTNVPGITNNFAATGCTLSITAGDWDLTAIATLSLNGSTTTFVRIGISTAPTSESGSAGDALADGTPPTTLTNTTLVVPSYRVSLTSTTTYYLINQSNFSAGTPQYTCRLSGRRAR